MGSTLGGGAARPAVNAPPLQAQKAGETKGTVLLSLRQQNRPSVTLYPFVTLEFMGRVSVGETRPYR